MYCRQCGSKLLDNDNFCTDCGVKIIKSEQITKNIEVETNKNHQNELPMNWYKFFNYFRIPISMITTIGLLFVIDYPSFYYNKTEFGIFLLFLGLLTFDSVLFYMMKNRLKNTLKLIIAKLIIEIACVFFYTIGGDVNNPLSIPIFISFSIIWFICNYIYFYKRKYIG